MTRTSFGLFLLLACVAANPARADDDEEKGAIPSAYGPFEHLVGGWKGQGIPSKNSLKGWPEKQMWSWKFEKGRPVGMTLEIAGGKILTKAMLSKDEKAGQYRLEGADPAGKPVAFSGKLDEKTGVLSLNREMAPADAGLERLDLAMNENKIRYSLYLFRQEPGAPQFAKVMESRMGKEGEAFAAGGAAADLPKCVVTGGAGSMSVSFDGKTYPICCSGCRDEFQENPKKYVEKFLARARDGEADGLKTTAATPGEKAKPPANEAPSASKPKGAVAKKSDDKPATEKAGAASKADGVLAQGQALEKSGKKQAALIYYKRVVKEFPDSPAAVTAKARLKSLGE